MKHIWRILISILLISCLGGCTDYCHAMIPNGLRYHVEDLPAIGDFSGTQYEDYKRHFPVVKYAVLYHDGTEETIAPDDVRLIRLLNFLAYSNIEGHSELRQSLLTKAEIEECWIEADPKLVIYFDDSEITWRTYRIPQIIIWGSTYLELQSIEEGTVNSAMQYYPYAEMLTNMVMNEKLPKDALYNLDSMEDPWLDLLAYSGFLD